MKQEPIAIDKVNIDAVIIILRGNLSDTGQC